MKTPDTHYWASLALLLLPTITLAQQPTPTSAQSRTASTTSASSPSCTASLITKLCDYKRPGPEFAVAAGSSNDCLAYCTAHQPCTFVIFAAGNPNTGTGTCWLYPGESYDPAAGTAGSACGNPSYSVYAQPVCDSSSTTATPTAPGAAYSCAATASPSAVASNVCAYPPPEACSTTGCTASDGASSCLSQCARALDCNYAVFNARNPSGTPYASGTCWLYSGSEKAFDASLAKACTVGDTAPQFVYNNTCPKPPRPSTSSSAASVTGTASGATTATTSGGIGSGTAVDASVTTTSSSKAGAPTGLSVGYPAVALGAALLLV